MANTGSNNRSNTTKRTTTQKRTNNSTRNTRSNKGKNTRSSAKKTSNTRNLSDEDLLAVNYIVIAFSILACILLFLCNFGKIGPAGDTVSKVMFGTFGSMAYSFPLFLLVYTFLWISKQSDDRITIKMFFLIVLFFAIGILSDMSAGYTKLFDTYNFKDMWLTGYENRTGGGIISGTIAFWINHYLDRFATILIAVAVIILCVFILVGKYIISAVSGSRELLNETSKEAAEYRREKIISRRQSKEEYVEEDDDDYEKNYRAKRAAQKEERQRRLREKEEQKQKALEARAKEKEAKETDDILRMDKKRTGVSLDTSLKESNASKRKDGMHEINIDSDYNPEKVDREVAVAKDNRPYDNNIKFHTADYDDDSQITEVNPIPQEKEKKQSEPVVKPKATFDEPVKQPSVRKQKTYKFPPINLLEPGKNNSKGSSRDELGAVAHKLEEALESFGVSARVTDVSQGPSVTRYELEPAVGVKVSRITALADDLKLHLAAKDIRIEAPIPGKSAVGIEVPNTEASGVRFRELIEDNEYKKFDGNIVFAVGKDISGKVIVSDISKMPHMLIAGSTGSGKSVCINTIIMSILYKHSPNDVQLIMVDPKVVELNVYNGIPHLMVPVVTDPKKAAAALNWAVAEMTDRYKKFADLGVRDLKGYNKKVDSMSENDTLEYTHLPQIVIVVDELADLMMVAAKEVEEAICRLAQLARACGIHLILATQRPSVDVITGLIKANMPSRVAFAVSSGVDSRTILDMNGAEKLLGKGDMLFFPQGYTKPARIQGAFISDNEVASVVEYVKENNMGFDKTQDAAESINNFKSSGSSGGTSSDGGTDTDELFVQAGRFIIECDKASIGNLQRKFKIGFNRAARIMDELCEAEVVGKEQGTKPREILMSPEQFEQYVDDYYV